MPSLHHRELSGVDVLPFRVVVLVAGHVDQKAGRRGIAGDRWRSCCPSCAGRHGCAAAGDRAGCGAAGAGGSRRAGRLHRVAPGGREIEKIRKFEKSKFAILYHKIRATLTTDNLGE